MSDVCGDNRFEIIEAYKKKLIEDTNIETRPEEMAVIDNILLRFWQMGWLQSAQPGEDIRAMCGECDAWNQYKNYPQPRWIPVTERLPEERDWYLGIFKEPDTGWINPIPFICDYLLGKKTKATTKEGWILKECTDREECIDYYFNLECVAWMPLPTPWEGGQE